jgi:DNA-directed RNA polymerase subunit F
MAQDLLRKKMDGISSVPDKEEQARSHLEKLFDAPLPEEAIEAIEELLKVAKLDDKQSTAARRARRMAKVVPA